MVAVAAVVAVVGAAEAADLAAPQEAQGVVDSCCSPTASA